MVPRGAGEWFVLEGPGWDREHRQERGLPRREAVFLQKSREGHTQVLVDPGVARNRCQLTLPLFSPPSLRLVKNCVNSADTPICV